MCAHIRYSQNRVTLLRHTDYVIITFICGTHVGANFIMASSTSEGKGRDSSSSISPDKIAVIGVGNLGIRIAGKQQSYAQRESERS